MRNTTSKNHAKLLFPEYRSNEQEALTYVESTFQNKTLRQYYNTKENRFNKIQTLQEAYDKSYTYHIKSAARMYAHFGYHRIENQKLASCLMRETKKILSSKGIGSKQLRASDVEAKIKLSQLLMKEACQIYDEIKSNNWKAYKGDFIMPWINTDEFEPCVNLQKIKTQLQRAIKRYTGLHCIAIFEIQPRKENGEFVLMPHFHVLLWGPEIDIDEFKRKPKCLSKKGNPKTIEMKEIEPSKRDFVNIISYNSKSPNMHKSKTQAGVKPHREEMPGYLLARHFEILSNIPLESMVFSSGSNGTKHREKVLMKLGRWDKKRSEICPRIMISRTQLDAFWASHWRDINYDDYLPVKVIYKRGK